MNNGIVWQSTIENGMVQYANLSPKEIEQLIQELDDAVADIAETYGL